MVHGTFDRDKAHDTAAGLSNYTRIHALGVIITATCSLGGDTTNCAVADGKDKPLAYTLSLNSQALV